jgi:hypothetical protein
MPKGLLNNLGSGPARCPSDMIVGVTPHPTGAWLTREPAPSGTGQTAPWTNEARSPVPNSAFAPVPLMPQSSEPTCSAA